MSQLQHINVQYMYNAVHVRCIFLVNNYCLQNVFVHLLPIKLFFNL